MYARVIQSYAAPDFLSSLIGSGYEYIYIVQMYLLQLRYLISGIPDRVSCHLRLIYNPSKCYKVTLYSINLYYDMITTPDLITIKLNELINVIFYLGFFMFRMCLIPFSAKALTLGISSEGFPTYSGFYYINSRKASFFLVCFQLVYWGKQHMCQQLGFNW